MKIVQREQAIDVINLYSIIRVKTKGVPNGNYNKNKNTGRSKKASKW